MISHHSSLAPTPDQSFGSFADPAECLKRMNLAAPSGPSRSAKRPLPRHVAFLPGSTLEDPSVASVEGRTDPAVDSSDAHERKAPHAVGEAGPLRGDSRGLPKGGFW